MICSQGGDCRWWRNHGVCGARQGQQGREAKSARRSEHMREVDPASCAKLSNTYVCFCSFAPKCNVATRQMAGGGGCRCGPGKPIKNTHFKTLLGFKNNKAAICSTSARVYTSPFDASLPSRCIPFTAFGNCKILECMLLCSVKSTMEMAACSIWQCFQTRKSVVPVFTAWNIIKSHHGALVGVQKSESKGCPLLPLNPTFCSSLIIIVIFFMELK